MLLCGLMLRCFLRAQAEENAQLAGVLLLLRQLTLWEVNMGFSTSPKRVTTSGSTIDYILGRQQSKSTSYSGWYGIFDKTDSRSVAHF